MSLVVESAEAVTASASVREVATAAKAAARRLVKLDEIARNATLEAMAQALDAAKADLFAANAEDLAAADALQGAERLSPATFSRLKLNEQKLAEMVEQVRSVKALPDPLGR